MFFRLGGAGGDADDCVVGFIIMGSEHLGNSVLCIVFNCKFEYF